MSIRMNVFGVKQTKRFLKKKDKRTEELTEKGIKNATLFLHGEVKESIAGRRAEKTSVDTGRFLNSVDLQAKNFIGAVFSNLGYSKFLEFGTSRFTGRRHFNNSKDRNRKKIGQIIQKSVNKV